jgi:hypothetical protein
LLKPGPNEVKLVVEIDDKVKHPRLEVSSQLLLNGPAAPAAPLPSGRFGAAAPTVAVGICLALALSSGGLWLSRRGRGRALAAGLLAISALAFGGAVWADLAKPKPPPKPQTVALPAGVHLHDKLTLHIVEDGDALKLVVNKSMLVAPPKAKAAE